MKKTLILIICTFHIHLFAQQVQWLKKISNHSLSFSDMIARSATDSEGNRFFPNPNISSFTIQSSGEGLYSIINELGERIQQFELNISNNYTITIDNINSGIYFIIGYNGDGCEYTKQKFVVLK